MVWRSIRPPLPGGLVMVIERSSRTSAIGKPMRSTSGTSFSPGSAKYPPVACPPHSSRCPVSTPHAIASRSSAVQPSVAMIGPSASALSVTRPVTITSAPAA